jgi:minor histocompatibility antigen H13
MSMEEMIRQVKRIHVDKLGSDQNIERMGQNDAITMPIFAGITLTGLYFAMDYFGKEATNHFILFYFGLVGGAGAKALLFMLTGDRFKKDDETFVFDFSIKMIGLEVQLTKLDIPCTVVSVIWMGIYAFAKNMLFNNFLALIFTLQAMKGMFIGNFKNGFILLTLLFFYDIFFVFGTDVMLTVAKGIDAPIKLIFPKDYTGEDPKFSLLGLGDIIIPGIFVSLCLRFDILKSIDIEELQNVITDEKDGSGDKGGVARFLFRAAGNSQKSYFTAVLIGYLMAIVATIIVMFAFDHGQPALLYLVPGCILMVLGTAWVKGETAELWEFSEDLFLEGSGNDEDDKKDN